MDPYAALIAALEGSTESRKAYNEWVRKGGLKVDVKVWSARVFGVPVWFSVERIGTKKVHGTFRHMTHGGLAEWTGAVHFGRIVDPPIQGVTNR